MDDDLTPAERAAVDSAIQELIDEGLAEAVEHEDGTVTYRATEKGWFKAQMNRRSKNN